LTDVAAWISASTMGAHELGLLRGERFDPRVYAAAWMMGTWTTPADDRARAHNVMKWFEARRSSPGEARADHPAIGISTMRVRSGSRRRADAGVDGADRFNGDRSDAPGERSRTFRSGPLWQRAGVSTLSTSTFMFRSRRSNRRARAGAARRATSARYRSYTCAGRSGSSAKFVLEQHEDDAFAVDGRCRATAIPHAHAPPVSAPLELGDRQDPVRRCGRQELERMDADGGSSCGSRRPQLTRLL